MHAPTPTHEDLAKIARDIIAEVDRRLTELRDDLKTDIVDVAQGLACCQDEVERLQLEGGEFGGLPEKCNCEQALALQAQLADIATELRPFCATLETPNATTLAGHVATLVALWDRNGRPAP